MNNSNQVFHCFDPLDANRCLGTYRSRSPRTRDELFSYSHLVLGHFTSSTFLPSILTHGLQPDFHKERVMDDSVPSDTESVYLAAHYDRFYIQRVIQHHGGSGVVVVVSVPVKALVPDESALSQIDREQNPIDVQLFLSLCFGACKHPGVIPPTSFVGIFDSNGSSLQ